MELQDNGQAEQGAPPSVLDREAAPETEEDGAPPSAPDREAAPTDLPDEAEPEGEQALSVMERIDAFERQRRAIDLPDDGSLLIPQVGNPDHTTAVLPGEWEPVSMPTGSRVVTWAFRWSVVALLVACGVAIALGIGWYLGTAEEEAAAVTDGYRDALLQVEGTLDDGVLAMADITSAESTAEQLVLELAPFTRFQGAVAALSSRVRADLPTTPPLAPRGALEELEPLRADLGLVTARGEALIDRLGKLITYRLVLAEMFALPELPDRATAAEIDTLSAALAQALADSVSGLNDLPADEFLEEHRVEIQETVDFIRDWQPGYVSALQTGDREQADLLARRAAGRVRQARDGVLAALETFRAWAEPEFAGLRGDVAGALILVGPSPTES